MGGVSTQCGRQCYRPVTWACLAYPVSTRTSTRTCSRYMVVCIAHWKQRNSHYGHTLVGDMNRIYMKLPHPSLCLN